MGSTIVIDNKIGWAVKAFVCPLTEVNGGAFPPFLRGTLYECPLEAATCTRNCKQKSGVLRLNVFIYQNVALGGRGNVILE